MNLQPHTITTIDGVEVKPGAEWPRRPVDYLRVDVRVKCVEASPPGFVAIASVAGVDVGHSDRHQTMEQAEREIRDRLLASFRSLFAR